MARDSHSEWFTVRGYEVDENNRLKIQCISDYMQEAAGIHAARLGFSIEALQARDLTWILARLQFAPGVLPLAGERMKVETWPVRVEGAQFRRDFLVTAEDAAGRNIVVARAISHWIVVNLETRRVGRIPEFIAAVVKENAELVMEDCREKIPAPESADPADEGCRFVARLADMDRNRHVNNVRYMDWMLESVPAAVREAGSMAFLEMLFKAESVRGDAVAARTSEIADAGSCVPGAPAAHSGVHAYSHALVREADGRELVRGRSVWYS